MSAQISVVLKLKKRSLEKEQRRILDQQKRKELELQKTFGHYKIKEDVALQLASKNKKLAKCYKQIHNALDALVLGRFDKAKEEYTKAREIYLKLEYHEKTVIYKKLSGLYNSIKRYFKWQKI